MIEYFSTWITNKKVMYTQAYTISLGFPSLFIIFFFFFFWSALLSLHNTIFKYQNTKNLALGMILWFRCLPKNPEQVHTQNLDITM